MFVVNWQDWKAHQFGDPKPPLHKETFTTREEAEQRKTELIKCGVMVCIMPLVTRPKYNARQSCVTDDGRSFNRHWKLHA